MYRNQLRQWARYVLNRHLPQNPVFEVDFNKIILNNIKKLYLNCFVSRIKFGFKMRLLNAIHD